MSNDGAIRGALLLAFMAGRWRGQVDLEVSYDMEQYGVALMESMYSRKTCRPAFPASTGRTVTVNLRSDRWREGVVKETNEAFEKAFELLKQLLCKEPSQKQRSFNFTTESND